MDESCSIPSLTARLRTWLKRMLWAVQRARQRTLKPRRDPWILVRPEPASIHVSRTPATTRIATTCPSSDGLNLVIDKNAQQRARNPGKSGSFQGNVVTRALKPSELGHGPR